MSAKQWRISPARYLPGDFGLDVFAEDTCDPLAQFADCVLVAAARC